MPEKSKCAGKTLKHHRCSIIKGTCRLIREEIQHTPFIIHLDRKERLVVLCFIYVFRNDTSCLPPKHQDTLETELSLMKNFADAFVLRLLLHILPELKSVFCVLVCVCVSFRSRWTWCLARTLITFDSNIKLKWNFSSHEREKRFVIN